MTTDTWGLKVFCLKIEICFDNYCSSSYLFRCGCVANIMDEPDFNIDDEIELEEMYQNEYFAYEEQLQADEEWDDPTEVTPVKPPEEKIRDDIMTPDSEELNHEYSSRYMPTYFSISIS